MRRFILYLLVTISSFAFSQSQLKGTVSSVKDGDTIVLTLADGQTVTVRLNGIDSPEKNQPYGADATSFTYEMCFGTQVTILSDGKDKYGRTIGTVYLSSGENLNNSIVMNGYAWHYKQYSTSTELADLESSAKVNRLGLWEDPNPIAPWDWRKGGNYVTSQTSHEGFSNYTSTNTVGAVKKTASGVLICKSPNAYAYHSNSGCRGLNRCSYEIVTIPKSQAEGIGRRACKICY